MQCQGYDGYDMSAGRLALQLHLCRCLQGGLDRLRERQVLPVAQPTVCQRCSIHSPRQNHRCVSHRNEAERFVPTPGQVFYYRKKARHPWATSLDIYKLMPLLAILKLSPFQPGRVAQSGNKATATVASSRSLSWNAIADQVVLGPGNATQNFPGTAHGHTVQVSRPASGLTTCNCTCEAITRNKSNP